MNSTPSSIDPASTRYRVNGVHNASNLLEWINNLPTLSPVLQRINAIISNPSSSADDVESALKLDPAIAGKVLRLANSAYVGIPRTVSSLKNAIVLLGFKRIQSLALASTILSACSRRAVKGVLDMYSYWRHSIMVALVAESIARHLNRYQAMDADDLFTAGILHDVGKLILGGFDPDRLESAARKGREQKLPLYAVEEPDWSHMRTGELLAYHWNFPRDLTAAIRMHHSPQASEEFVLMVSVVHLSDVMVHIMGVQTIADEQAPALSDHAIAQVRLLPERLRVISQDAAANEKRIESLLSFMS